VLNTRNNLNRKRFQPRNIMQEQCEATKTGKQLASVYILHHESYLAAYSKVLRKNQRLSRKRTRVQRICTPKGNGGKQHDCAKHTSRVHSFLLSCVTGGTWTPVTPCCQLSFSNRFRVAFRAARPACQPKITPTHALQRHRVTNTSSYRCAQQELVDPAAIRPCAIVTLCGVKMGC
jgi:hypothetical protein